MAEPTYETTARIHAALGGSYRSTVKEHRLKLAEATAKQAAFRVASKQEVAVGYELLADAFVVIRELLDVIEQANAKSEEILGAMRAQPDRFGVIRDVDGLSS